jgi:hypothetical protein
MRDFNEFVNEGLYDLVKDLRGTIGSGNHVKDVENHLNRKLNQSEISALIDGGVIKSGGRVKTGNFGVKTVWTGKNARIEFGKFKGKTWENIPSWYKAWLRKQDNINVRE